MPKPDWLTPTRVAGLVLPGVRKVASTIKDRQADWDAANAEARERSGPLWVVLGDSTQIGIGASDRGHASVAIVHDWLNRTTKQSWRVINLARHGAKLDDVTNEQVPRLLKLGPADLVTLGAGANDVLWSFGLKPVLDALDRILAVLPRGTVIGTVPGGWIGKGRKVNAYLRVQGADRGLKVAEAGVVPKASDMFAADGIHPNDRGYRFIADRMAQTIGSSVSVRNAGAELTPRTVTSPTNGRR